MHTEHIIISCFSTIHLLFQCVQYPGLMYRYIVSYTKAIQHDICNEITSGPRCHYTMYIQTFPSNTDIAYIYTHYCTTILGLAALLKYIINCKARSPNHRNLVQCISVVETRQHKATTPEHSSFRRKNELPQMGLRPTTFCVLDKCSISLAIKAAQLGRLNLQSKGVSPLINRITHTRNSAARVGRGNGAVFTTFDIQQKIALILENTQKKTVHTLTR